MASQTGLLYLGRVLNSEYGGFLEFVPVRPPFPDVEALPIAQSGLNFSAFPDALLPCCKLITQGCPNPFVPHSCVALSRFLWRVAVNPDP
jgi:hypothetical protein